VDRWELLRDIGTWGSGLALIFWEAHLSQPNEYVVGAAVVLIAPRVVKHLRVLSGRTGGPSSPESLSSPPQESSGREGTDDE
jgi:hypothetical protein